MRRCISSVWQSKSIILYTAILLLALGTLEPFHNPALAANGRAGSITHATIFAKKNAVQASDDPLGASKNYMVFADHELFIPTLLDNIIPEVMMPDATGTIPSAVDLQPGTIDTPVSPAQVYVARGRVTTQNYDQVISAMRGSANPGVYISDRNTSPALSFTFPTLAARVFDFSDFIDVASGDLDKLADSAGNNHNEVVLVWASGSDATGFTINLQVADYTDPNTDTTKNPIGYANATTTLGIDAHAATGDFFEGDNLLAVALGDFDGDGQTEIAVTHLQNNTTLVVTTFRYTNDGHGNRALTQENVTTVAPADSGYFGTIDAGAGDIDGDNIAELIIATMNGSSNYGPVNILLRGSNNLDLQPFYNNYVAAFPVPNNGFAANSRVQLTTGIFDFQPPFGVTAWAIGWSDLTNAYQINLMQFEWNSADKTIDQLGATLNVNGYYADAWSIAAGNTIGVLDMQNQNWNLAFYGWQTASGNPVCLTIIGPGANSVPAPTTCGGGINFTYASGQRLPILAFDYDGNSLFLGTPVEMLIEKVVSTDYIIYEPPKHTFYNIDQSGQWGAYGQIVNVSRFPDFNVTFTQGNSTSMQTSSTSTSDWTIGGSATIGGSYTASGGVDVGLVNVDIKVTSGFSATLGYSHNRSKQFTDSKFSTSSISYATTTTADDTIGGNVQTLAVWRYRVYGMPPTDLKNNPGGFYDYVIPGNIVKLAGNAGMELDWYQPLHENGNLLSYPQATANNFTPSDIGTVSVNGQSFTAPMIPAEQITCCGNGGSTNLSFSGGIGSNSQVTSNNTLNESLDVYQNYTIQADTFGEEEQASASWDVNFNNSNSWGSAATQNKTTTLNEAITLNYASDSTASGYNIYPVMHATPDGTFKISHAFSFLDSDLSGFWNDYYGQKPDPALNLPYRFYEYTFSNNAFWAPRQDDARKSIRGFALLKATPNPLTGKNDPYPDAPVESDAVLIQTNIYNFSAGGITNRNPTNAKNLVVQFQYAPFDGTNETGPRNLIGTATLNQLKPLQMLPVQVAWDTAGLGGSTPCATQQYRIIVTLDPNNTIHEIYETENPNAQYPYVFVNPETQQPTTQYLNGIFPGQNNEGYGYAVIQAKNPGGTCNPGFTADVSLRQDSLTAQDAVSQKIRDDNPRLFLNQPARLRLKVYSDRPHGLFGHVLIYDGKPQKGNLIAAKFVHTGNPKGATIWFDWVPTTPGKHVLYARYLGRRADPRKELHREILRVNVIQEVKTRDR